MATVLCVNRALNAYLIPASTRAARPAQPPVHIHVAQQLEEGIVGHVRDRPVVERVDVERLAEPTHHVLDDVGRVVRAKRLHIVRDRDLARDEIVHLPPHGVVTSVPGLGLPD
jgi:hypothetical protein